MIQINGDSVLFRLAWTWLNRYHEPTLVGAAVTLFGLAFGLPAVSDPIPAARSASAAALSPTASSRLSSASGGGIPGEIDVPRDDDYYRQKWARDAAAFYDANPPRDFDAVAQSGPVMTASLKQSKALSSDPSDVAQASHSDSRNLVDADAAVFAPSQAAAGIVAASGVVATLSPQSRNWRVATFVAAGLLASILFTAVWPARTPPGLALPTLALPEFAMAGDDHDRQSPPGDAVAITLPSAWVGVRPTVRETLRRGVLGASYAMAGSATWGIWF
jgi:hypothetical protein